MKLSEIFDTLDELKIDNEQGLGAVPDNQNVDYKGLRVQMKPSMFLKLAHKLEQPTSVDHIVSHIERGGAIGAPFLIIDIPRDWWDSKFTSVAKVIGHEGRNRMTAAIQTDGDNPIEVHLFFRGEVRARHLTPEIIKGINAKLISQDGRVVIGPIFTAETVQLNELFDNPYQTTWQEKDNKAVEAKFVTDEGTAIRVDFMKWDTLVSVAFEASYKDPKSGQTVATFFKTGTGDAPRIFATVMSTIQTYVKKYRPEFLFFTAEEPSRIKLYNTMVRILGSNYNRIDLTLDNIEQLETSDSVKGYLKQYEEALDPGQGFLLQKKKTRRTKPKVSLKELFKKTYDIKPGHDINDWMFTTDSGQQYVVVLLDERYYENRKFHPALMLEFGMIDDLGFITTTVTGSGDAFKIFATVAEILKQAIANSGVEYVMFGATLQEPSRIKLYDSFLKLLPKFLPGWYVHETEMHHNMGQKQYILKKGKK